MNKYDEALNKLYTLLNKVEEEINKHANLVKSNQEEINKDNQKIQENKQELEELFYIRKVLNNYTFDLNDLKKKNFWKRIGKFLMKVLGIGALIFMIGSYVQLSLIASLLIALFSKITWELLNITLSYNIKYILNNYNILDTQDKINNIIQENEKLNRDIRDKNKLIEELENKDLSKEKDEALTIKEDIKLVIDAKNKALEKVLTAEMNEEINQEFAKDDIMQRVRGIKEG